MPSECLKNKISFCIPVQDNSAVEKRKKDLEKVVSSLEKLMEQSERDKEGHLAAQRHYQAVSAGLSSNQDGQDASLNNQLMGRSVWFWLP